MTGQKNVLEQPSTVLRRFEQLIEFVVPKNEAANGKRRWHDKLTDSTTNDHFIVSSDGQAIELNLENGPWAALPEDWRRWIEEFEDANDACLEHDERVSKLLKGFANAKPDVRNKPATF